MTDYTDPESPVADPHASDRLTFENSRGPLGTCTHCLLLRREHINGYFCPEWRLRQLDGDR